jgi:hypothetical protein
MQHLHTEYERELVPLFVKVLGLYASGSKLEDDTADRSQIVTVKLGAQSDEQLHLLFVEGLAVGQIISPDPDASTIAATNSFDGVRTGKRHNVPPNCHLGNIELMRQIVVCIVPSEA